MYITQRITNYYLGNHIKNTEMGRECSMYGERKGIQRVLGGKPEVNGLFGHRWQHNIKTHLQEMGLVAWTGLICSGQG